MGSKLVESGRATMLQRLARGLFLMLGIFFLSSAFTKVMDDAPITAAVMYQLRDITTSPAIILAVTFTIIVVEALAGVAFVIGWIHWISIAGAAVMLVVYSGALTRMLLEPGAPASCGCGAIANLDGLLGDGAGMALARNAILLGLLVAACILLRSNAASLPRPAQGKKAG